MALELLSPAGSPESLRAAVQSGCGAVYLGWGDFNARRGAKNFTDEEFAAAIRYCHVRGVRVFLTLNTLLTDRELPAALDAARTACRLGVDSVLVQDWGLFDLLRQSLPELPLHASTQTSVFTGGGVEELRTLIKGKLVAFTGNSGVGKSSILNRLAPELRLSTGEVSEKLGRGRHTTRHVELFALDESTYVMDTPGFASFDTDQMDVILKENLQYAFPDFAPYIGRCQFADCSHRREPGCAIRAALDQGQLEPTRYESYCRLYEKSAQIKEWELK